MRVKRYRALVSLLAAVVAGTALPAVAQSRQDTPFARMQAALARADVADAETAARATLAADTTAAHHRDALMALANLAWRVHLDTAAAERFIREAAKVATTDARTVSFVQSARARLSAHDYDGAITDARNALAAATTPRDIARALDIEGRAVSEGLMIGARPDTNNDVQRTLGDLSRGVSSLPGEASIALQLVRVAAIARNGPALLAGWRSYYLTLTNGGSTNVLAGPRDMLQRVLPLWSAASDTRSTRLEIVRALADSRMFQSASYLARLPLPDGSALAATDPRAREIVAYAKFYDDAVRVTGEFYRLTALHTENESVWRDSLEAVARLAWPRLQWPNEPPQFSFHAFEAEAGQRFGLIMNFGTTGGFKDAHIGHTVADEHHRVSQWGRSTAFHFVQLDQMISNGYLSWFWDGRGSDGGWNNAAMVVQVRPAYASTAILAWVTLTDSAARAALDLSIAADSAADVARARTTEVAYFPSVARRLDREGQLALLDSLKHRGLTGDILREQFVRQLSDETEEYSIFQHEGRHAIDKGIDDEGHCGVTCTAKSWMTPAADLEFTAKLAQVEFGPRAETALGGIMTASVGDQTPHGTADARIFRGVLEWMTEHESQIAHLDRAAPLLPQLPLLTANQLRAAFRSLDPLAPCHGAKCN